VKKATAYALLRAAVIAAFLILAGRLWYMQIVQVNAYRAQGKDYRLQTRIVEAPRGIIYDRNGAPLVRNVATYAVTVTPAYWPSGRGGYTESRRLSNLLHGYPSARKIRNLASGSPYLPVTQPVLVKRNIDVQTYWTVKAENNLLPGVGGTQTFTRHYLQTSPYPFSHLIGYVGSIDPQTLLTDQNGQYTYQRYTPTDLVGQTGLESMFDHQLHGINGVQSSEINAAGDQISPWKTIRPAIPGYGIRLTIGRSFEEKVAQDLQTGMTKLGVTKGAAVAMNPKNGQILAMVSLPSYNSDVFTASRGTKRLKAINAIFHNPSQPLFDTSISGQMPPGSIFKIITASGALVDHIVTPSTIVDDTGILSPCPGCGVFHGWLKGGLGPVNIVSAIEQSSDIYFYQAAGGGPAIPRPGLGPYRLGQWERAYGLGKPTGIGLPGEMPGLVPTPKEILRSTGRHWSIGDSYNTGIGQGDNLVTPLQMARMVSVVANGGNLVKPQLVAAQTYPTGPHPLPGHNYALVPDVTHRHLVPGWAVSLIQQGMRLGVTQNSGTSWGELDPRVNAAGKTGTAEAPGGTVDAWWVGYAPYNNPKIAVAVVIPQADAEGAFAAAPIGGKIMDDYFHISYPQWINNVYPHRLDFFN
jgi:penicillin-binding protein 2